MLIESVMLNLISLGRLTPFSVKLPAVHMSLWCWVCYVANACLCYRMLSKHVHYWLDEFSHLNLHYLVFLWNFLPQNHQERLSSAKLILAFFLVLFAKFLLFISLEKSTCVVCERCEPAVTKHFTQFDNIIQTWSQLRNAITLNFLIPRSFRQ